MKVTITSADIMCYVAACYLWHVHVVVAILCLVCGFPNIRRRH